MTPPANVQTTIVKRWTGLMGVQNTIVGARNAAAPIGELRRNFTPMASHTRRFPTLLLAYMGRHGSLLLCTCC